MTTSILKRLTHLSDQMYSFLTTTASYYPRSTIANLGNGTRYTSRVKVTALPNILLGSRDLSSTLMWPHRADDHVTTSVMISATTYTPDRTDTLAVADVTIHVVMNMISDVVNIGGIMTLIVASTPVLGLNVTTLLLGVGLGLIDQTVRQNRHALAETNTSRI